MLISLENLILSCIYFDEKQDFVNLDDLSEDYFEDKALFKKVHQYRRECKPYDYAVAQRYFGSDSLLKLEKGVSSLNHLQNYPHYLYQFKKEKLEKDILSQISRENIDPSLIQKYFGIINSSISKDRIYNFENDLHDYLNRFEERLAGKYEKYSLNLSGFDEILGSIRTQKLITVGANSGVGKTNFMLKFMSQLIQQGIKCLYLSSEMSYDELVERLVAMNSSLRYWDILNARLQPAGIQEFTEVLGNKISGKGGFICEITKFNTVKVRELIDRTQCKFVFVDYLQRFNLNTDKNQTRASVLSDIVNDLKALCVEKKIVICGASQLKQNANRESAQLSDLKESGGIEEASDVVVLLSTIGEDENYKKIRVDIAKQRHGITGKFVYVLNRKNCDMEYSFKDTEKLKEMEKAR